MVDLWMNGKRKQKLVHRLVAEAFIPNPQNLPEVNHKDENPANCNADNLEWCDRIYNMNYGSCAKLNVVWAKISKQVLSNMTIESPLMRWNMVIGAFCSLIFFNLQILLYGIRSSATFTITRSC